MLTLPFGRYLSKIPLPFRSLMMAELQLIGFAGSSGAALRAATVAAKTDVAKSFIFVFYQRIFGFDENYQISFLLMELNETLAPSYQFTVLTRKSQRSMSIWNDNNMGGLVLQPKYAEKDQLRRDCLVPIQNILSDTLILTTLRLARLSQGLSSYSKLR